MSAEYAGMMWDEMSPPPDSCEHGTPWLYRCPLCTPDEEVKE